jgi:phage terminase large subunit GpA-like protein
MRKDGVRAGAEADPPGYCHFPAWLDEGYFRQITAEYLEEQSFRGRVRRFWKQRPGQRDNHFLDTSVYCMSLAEHLGLSIISASDWAEIARDHGVPLEKPLSGATLAPPDEPGHGDAEPAARQAATASTPIGGSTGYAAEDLDARFARLFKMNSESFQRPKM